MRPVAPCRMHACMRLSLDSRRGKSGGTTAVPYLVVMTSVASPFVLAGASVSTLSTGAQSRPWQHSVGYHSCAMAGNCRPSASAIANSVEDAHLPINTKRDHAPGVSCNWATTIVTPGTCAPRGSSTTFQGQDCRLRQALQASAKVVLKGSSL